MHAKQCWRGNKRWAVYDTTDRKLKLYNISIGGNLDMNANGLFYEKNMFFMYWGLVYHSGQAHGLWSQSISNSSPFTDRHYVDE